MVADRLGAHHAHPSQAGTTSPKSTSRTMSQPKVVIVFELCVVISVLALTVKRFISDRLLMAISGKEEYSEILRGT